jgi:4-amino-4-deoxy-L-arabinose transferase-like glycosyltransferase
MYIILILSLGLVLRIISLNQSLWLDEATTALAAKMGLGDLFTKFLPGDFHPPLYYLTVKYWAILFGTSEISLRFPSVLFGLGTVYLTYLVGKKIFTEKTALISGLLLSTGGLAIYYSQEARMYGMAAFLVTAAMYFFITKRWVCFSVVLALIGMTDYIALLILPVFWLIGYKNKAFVLYHIPLAFSFFLWLPVFSRQLEVGLSIKESLPAWWGILGTLTLKNIALFPIKFVIGRISFDNNLVYALVLVPVFAFFAYILTKSVKSSKLLWFWLLVPIMVGALISIRIPTLTYFRFLFCLPPLYLLAAHGLQRFDGTKYKLLLFGFIAINLTTSTYYLFTPKFHREDWRGLVNTIEKQKTENSVTVFLKNSNMEAYRYYAPDAKIIGAEGLDGTHDQVWLMNYLRDVFDPGSIVGSNIENLGYTYSTELVHRGVGATLFKK